MIIKATDLNGPALDWAVSLITNPEWDHSDRLGSVNTRDCPQYNWGQGGPLLTEARISRTIDHSGLWIAYLTDEYWQVQCDRSELVAGLRCYVSINMGVEVEIPDDLMGKFD